MKARWLFILSVIFAAPFASAFDRDRCGTLFPKTEDEHPPYYSPLYIFTMFPSTTSYFSSIGPCSMYGGRESSARTLFITESIASLRTDASRGDGEFLQALAELSGCPSEQYKTFSSVIQSQFANLFASPNIDSTVLIGKIDSAIYAHEILRSTCKL